MGYLLAYHVVMFAGSMCQGPTPLTLIYGVYLPNQHEVDGSLPQVLYVLPLIERMLHYELTL